MFHLVEFSIAQVLALELREEERSVLSKVQLHENSIPHQKKKFFVFHVAVCAIVKQHRESKNARRSHKSLCSGPCYSIERLSSVFSIQVHDKQHSTHNSTLQQLLSLCVSLKLVI